MARVKAKAEPATLAQEMNVDGDRLANMASVAARFSGWRPAKEVLTKVRGVRTIFPGIDLATRIGAYPIERPTLVHGPSNHGKSEMCLGLIKSFLDRGHFGAFIDAEFSTPETWLRQLGLPIDNPAFTALRPGTYEQAVDAVKSWAETIGDARAKGQIPKDTTGICVVDSITKLTPKDLLAKVAKSLADDGEAEETSKPQNGVKKKPKRGIDGAGGRAGQIKAAMNNAWMNQLVPLMGQTGTCIVIITREYENTDSDMWAEEFIVAGGKNIFYDSSLVVRVSLAGQITHGEGSAKRTYGERHKVTIRKTKIARKEQKYPVAYFNSSNGVLVPAGFDTPRDYLETAIDIGIVELHGSHYVFGKKKLGQGEHNVVKMLHNDPKLFAEIEAATRDSIEKIIAQEPGIVEETPNE
jgi:RecA/RadA recombinase